ncbi:MAG: ABC transporter ATP-binding protein [Dehalococcoidia bacterium]|nr:ABC transporter ATP-binding protein [Dehalococcoidia bacterium]
MSSSLESPILRLQDLHAEFVTPEGIVKAVNGVSLSLRPGGTLAITGESGSGKTSIALSILNLLPHPGRIASGQIYFSEVDLLSLRAEEMRRVRGRRIGMVFQDPATGLNPVLSAGQQVEEIITTHLSVSKREARRRSLEVLAQMGLPEPEQVASRYPFQLSGGMAQRVMIAIATALNPELLILDEPTSALDVTIQAAILEDIDRLQERHGTSILLITHDLGVVAQMADEVAVMYAGAVAEYGPARILFERPRHPYTWSLLGSRPRWDRDERRRLASIRGAPPSLIDLPDECPFLPRCPKATSVCRTSPAPQLAPIDSDAQLVACYNPVYQAGDEEAAG